MFENIGGKLKMVAQIVTWFGIIASVVVGIGMLYVMESPIGILVMIGGALVSWLSSLTLYGFGQLIENTDILAGRKKSSPREQKIAAVTELRRKGLITEEEFRQKMEELK